MQGTLALFKLLATFQDLKDITDKPDILGILLFLEWVLDGVI